MVVEKRDFVVWDGAVADVIWFFKGFEATGNKSDVGIYDLINLRTMLLQPLRNGELSIRQTEEHVCNLCGEISENLISRWFGKKMSHICPKCFAQFHVSRNVSPPFSVSNPDNVVFVELAHRGECDFYG